MGAQADPERSKPRMFGSHIGSGELPWSWATERLNKARNYWIATTRSSGKPHSRPVWGIWLDNAFYFSTGSLAASNLSIHSAITVHLESGSEVVIIEGIAKPLDDEDLVERVVNAYNQKYNWNIDPHNLPGPYYAVYPQVAFGWHFKESDLHPESTGLETATRWQF
jgi:Pyridoxamine 5'-phosphate oxidase